MTDRDAPSNGTTDAKPGDLARSDQPPSRFAPPSHGYAPPVPVQRPGVVPVPPVPVPPAPVPPGAVPPAPPVRPAEPGGADRSGVARPGAERTGERPVLGDRPGDRSARGAADADADRVVALANRRREGVSSGLDRGTTIIANEVVEKISGIAARGVPGVYDLGGDMSRAVSAVKERMGLGPGDGGVSVRVDGGRAAVKVTLVVEFGHMVYPVTEQVRAEVIAAVENMLGLDVTTVDIVVDDVHVADGERR